MDEKRLKKLLSEIEESGIADQLVLKLSNELGMSKTLVNSSIKNIILILNNFASN